MKEKIIITEIQERLWKLQDKEYQKFHSHLMPNIQEESIIGIRVPILRKFAKELEKEFDCSDFLKELPHQYYEENNLHGFLIENMKDYENCLRELERFLPYIDNWATCDSVSPKIFKKHKKELLERIPIWIKADETYTVRFAIGMLMTHFLDEDFSTHYPEMVAAVSSEEYYINMMRAWYFATALAKQYPQILPFLENRKLDAWTHNKTIQKAIESYRITKEQKEYLRTLKIAKSKLH